ncbi:hypothetical protein [Halorubrum lipolyticum]|uniref:RNA ligase domain-containing protein n=1 Tax=Halorubrum lipolyticum DSM 21995 TaxID=1227482 RepID=M0P228_9EURY|nr:hypothetical protein [Halorubrum lipolyticum]EMA62865.1 hypothetical protein C469_04062 [Halorubrum lipolyticum DSM 21995]
MRSFPPLPDVRGSPAPDDLLDGHLWLLELIDGTGLRFSMDESGLLRFGGPETTYAGPEAVPIALRPAVGRVRERFDREALRGAVDDPEGVVFFGVATHHRGTDYDWDRLPPFLGTDVWIGPREETETGAFRPPDAAAAIFEGIGLGAVNAFEREVNGRDFDPETYAIPGSAWRDGPAAGVVVRNKRGGRGKVLAAGAATGAGERPREGDSDVPPLDDPEAIAAAYATEERIERVVDDLDRRKAGATVDAVADGVVEAVARETPVRFGAGGERADPDRVRAAVVERVRVVVDGR